MTIEPKPSFLIDGRIGRLARLAGRFKRDERGANAIEFGLVALPFFAIVMAIIEASLSFFAGQVLETGLRDGSRAIRLGYAQTAGFTQSEFRKTMCEASIVLLDCDQIHIDVRSFANFGEAAAGLPPMVNEGTVDMGNMAFDPGGPGSIVVVRAVYQWPSFANILGSSLANMKDGTILLMATTAFRNEVYSTTPSNK